MCNPGQVPVFDKVNQNHTNTAKDSKGNCHIAL